MKSTGIAHFYYDVGGHRAYTGGDALGEYRLVTRYKDNCHGFTDGAAYTEDNCGKNAGFRGRQGSEEHAAFVRCAERQRPLVIAAGDCIQRGFGGLDDGGEYHDTQQNSRCEERFARAAHKVFHYRHDDHQSEKAVNDGGNTSQQVYRGLHEAVELLRAVMRHEYRAENSDGHADYYRDTSDEYRADYHREDTVTAAGGLPFRAEQEVGEPYLCHSGNAVREQVNADEHYRKYRNTGAYQEQRMHDAFFDFLHIHTSLNFH